MGASTIDKVKGSGNGNQDENKNANVTPPPPPVAPKPSSPPPPQTYTSKSKGTRLVVIGFASLAILFVIYGRYQDPANLTPDAIHIVQRLAYGFYVTMTGAFCTIAYGMSRYYRAKITDWNAGQRDLNSTIAASIWNSRARKIFVITFVIYGIFFSLASSTLVYQPGINFETHYNAEIPSGFVSPCCDDIGYMPKIIIYLTENVGLQIIPINLVLQVIVSYLVGLNASLAASAYAISKKRSGLGTIGAATGLFIACPTCAGTFFSIFVGTASGIVLSAALSQMQTMFIAISIPVLLLTPYLIAKRIRYATCSGDKCKITDKGIAPTKA